MTTQEQITNITASERQTNAWGGCTGIAYTITGELPDGKRKVLRKVCGLEPGFVKLEQGRVPNTATNHCFQDKAKYSRTITTADLKRLKAGDVIA
jgi:hypothetical protein